MGANNSDRLCWLAQPGGRLHYKLPSEKYRSSVSLYEQYAIPYLRSPTSHRPAAAAGARIDGGGEDTAPGSSGRAVECLTLAAYIDHTVPGPTPSGAVSCARQTDGGAMGRWCH